MTLPLCLWLLLTATTPQTAPVLGKIAESVKAAYAKQERPLVIFDLEGTLFDNRPRIVKILKEFAEQELKTDRPEAAQKIMTLTAAQVQYVLADTLRGLGITEEAVLNNATVFWSSRFYTDEYLTYDTPMPGAVAFVRNLYSTGARIIYLSARDAPRQLLGTVRQLRDAGYPIGVQASELLLRPGLQTQDAIFKQQSTNYLRTQGKIIAAFDSEPANVNFYRRVFAGAAVVYVQGNHMPNAPGVVPDIDSLEKFD